MKLTKSKLDEAREAKDLAEDPTLVFLANMVTLKFNVGDILIKKHLEYDYDTEKEKWELEVDDIGAPVKYVYAFENKLGVGYIKQLRVDGSGFTSELMCTANFDPDQTRFVLDPDFMDHILIGEGDDFDYHKEYADKKAFRQEAYKKNMKLLVKTWHIKHGPAWLASLQPGDVFWAGHTMDQMVKSPYKVLNGVSDKDPLEIRAEDIHGAVVYLREDWFHSKKVTDKQPYPMEDPLCGQAK